MLIHKNIISLSKVFNKLALICLVLLTASSIAVGQNKKKVSPKKKFFYEKTEDGTRIISAYIFVKAKKGWAPVSDLEVNFTASDDSTKVKFGNVNTDKDGYSILHIDKDYKLISNEDGLTNFEFIFKGNDSLKSVKAKLKIIETNLEISFDKNEESNNAIVKVINKNSLPLEKVKVKIFVKRMHSLLPIGEARTDSSGFASFEIPKDIPGDYDGIINIVAMIEKDRKYGTISTSKDIDWGVPNTYRVSDDEKNLWSKSAPLWMEIAVLSIFFIIFVFFIIAIYNVVLMSKDQ